MNKVKGMILTITLVCIMGVSSLAMDMTKDTQAKTDSAKASNYIPKADTLASYLKSGKPTLALFYYSVACSCTAARCAIAAAAIDSIPELNGKNSSLNLVRIDAYRESEVEVPYNLMIMPAVVYYDKTGKEVNRLEWGTNRDAIKMLIEHPEIKQIPID